MGAESVGVGDFFLEGGSMMEMTREQVEAWVRCEAAQCGGREENFAND